MVLLSGGSANIGWLKSYCCATFMTNWPAPRFCRNVTIRKLLRKAWPLSVLDDLQPSR